MIMHAITEATRQACRLTVAERDDLNDRIDILKEALRNLLRLDEMERSGLAEPCRQRELWRKAIKAAEDVLLQDGPA